MAKVYIRLISFRGRDGRYLEFAIVSFLSLGCCGTMVSARCRCIFFPHRRAMTGFELPWREKRFFFFSIVSARSSEQTKQDLLGDWHCCAHVDRFWYTGLFLSFEREAWISVRTRYLYRYTQYPIALLASHLYYLIITYTFFFFSFSISSTNSVTIERMHIDRFNNYFHMTNWLAIFHVVFF